jgi:hypothetical protein
MPCIPHYYHDCIHKLYSLETDSEGEGDENNEGRKSEIEDEEVQLKDTNSQQGSSLSRFETHEFK